ncbi:hypothetical protein MHY87_16550 [Microvirga sp. ACRRW]|uniref:sulfatase-like hydrolase/transferase n=1 Tax=Microvirga sp. ACRRW TaxID=2918205 RepID=UPI001EF50700|nr:sulfatase-like hydrolase/transferase [Microvirga sp. ACRRW]MCG7394516.1 hypothetical protein [Microvirga sp. ACRRW]
MSKSLVASVLLASISYFWLGKALINTVTDISTSDIFLILALSSLVILVQIAVFFLARAAVQLLFPLFSLLNTYLLFIVLSAEIGVMSLWAQIGICAAILALYGVALDIVLRAGRMQRWLVLGVPVLAALFTGISAWPLLVDSGADNTATPANIRTVEFKNKPNLYFLSFDAMVPVSLSSKFIGVPNPPYLDVLKKHGANFIANNFSDAVPTKRALANILTLSPVAQRDVEADRIITGRVPSALGYILSANGYKTHFTFDTGFFGSAKGQYLTSYNLYRPHSACQFLADNARQYGFFGYCPLRDLKIFDGVINAVRERSFLDFAYGLIETIARDKNSGPHFYMQHILYPSHTLPLFAGSAKDNDNYKAYFERRSAIAAKAMDRMLTEIRKSDPTAIVFLYGDHGAFVSRPVQFDKDRQFFVQDRYGTLGAVINAEQCEPYLTPPEGQRFQTNARIVTGLVRCLAGGESPFINEVDFGVIRQINENERFENYVYE